MTAFPIPGMPRLFPGGDDSWVLSQDIPKTAGFPPKGKNLPAGIPARLAFHHTKDPSELVPKL